MEPPRSLAGERAYRREIALQVVWLYLLFAFAGGVVLPFQAGINAELADWLGSPVRAAFVSFLVGTLVLLVAAALVFKPLPSGGRIGDVPWWAWVGGALGAFYVAASIVSAPKLGAATLIALVVAGQALASLVVDHFGWVGFEAKEISFGRIAGMLLVGAGVALVRFF
jgi:bacterial/archaeal transporter family-2 protein